MNFRLAKPSEMDRVFMMGFDVWHDGAGEKEYLDSCRHSSKYARGNWYVIEHNQELLSSLIVYSIDSVHSIFGIGSIATPPSLRKHGYASKLIKASMDHFRTASQEAKFFLYSDISSEFYERFGFSKLPKALQLYEKSDCMVSPASLLSLLASKKISVPKYF